MGTGAGAETGTTAGPGSGTGPKADAETRTEAEAEADASDTARTTTEARVGPQELRGATARHDNRRGERPHRRRRVAGLHPRTPISGSSVATGVLACALAAAPPRARADDALRPAAPELRSTADLDGLYLWLGPSGAAAHIDGSWFSSWGGGVQVLRVRERARLGVVGAWLSGVHYAGRDGGRVALQAVVGTRRLFGGAGPMLGAGAGPVLELGLAHHPWAGAEASAWLFAGISPYVRAGAVTEAGAYVELGVQVSLPVRRW